MADPTAIQLLEGIYARVDQQVREIVSSMLPGVTIAAQDDGAVVADNHRILNFQGPGVTVSDEPVRRRVNVYVPGAPVSSATTTLVSNTTAKVFNLWNGSSNNAPPANWQTVGFDDSAWTAAVAANRTTGMGPPSGATAIWTTANPASSTQEILTRQTFTLPAGSVSSATLTLSADDQINAIYVNGTLLDFSGPPGYGPPSYTTTTLNVPVNLLSSGTNLLAVWAKNFDPSVVGTTTLSWNYTITGSEPVPSVWLTGALPPFTGNFSISIHASAGTAGSNIAYWFRRSSDLSNSCYSAYWSLLSGATDATHNRSVGVPTSSWRCYDWDTLHVGYATGITGHVFSPGTVVTVTLTASSLPAGIAAWVGYRLDVGSSAAGTDTRYQLLSEKNQTNGYAGLDANTHVPTAQLGSGSASSLTYLRGDSSWAAVSGGGGSTILGEVIVATTQSTITFAGIPQTYRNLELWLTGRTNLAGQTTEAIGIRFNADSTASYDMHAFFHGDGGALTVSQTAASTSGDIGALGAATAPTGYAGRCVVQIHDYTRSTWKAGWLGRSQRQQNAPSANVGLVEYNSSGQWRTNAAVTQIDLIGRLGGSFVAGTVATLYGV